MSSVKIEGNASGTGIFTIASPNSNTNRTLTLPNSTGTIALQVAPQVTVYTSGSGTYTTPSGCVYLVIEMAGGGGGGSGAGSATGPAYGSAGTAGGSTTFGSSLLTCNGGAGGTPAGGASVSGLGGSTTVNSPASGFGLTGGSGVGVTVFIVNSGGVALNGCTGGVNPFGGGGGRGNSTTVNTSNAPANTGAGGIGGIGDANGYNGTGGGAGGYIKAIIASPSASYSYAVGSGGAGGAGSAGKFYGESGAAGIIIVTAFF